MAKPRKHLVCYDVANDRERGKVCKILEGYGFRMQKSVFECLLTPGRKRALAAKLGELDLASGIVSIYRLDADEGRLDIGANPADYPSEADERRCAFFV